MIIEILSFLFLQSFPATRTNANCGARIFEVGKWLPSNRGSDRRRLSNKCNAGNLRAQFQESFLQDNIIGLTVMMCLLLMKEITTAYFRLLIVTNGKSYLRLIPFLQIVRRSPAAHSCWNPSGIDCICINSFPFPGYCHAKHHYMQLRIRICNTSVIIEFEAVEL